MQGHVHAAEFRRCLLQLDVAGVIKLWKHVAPHLAGQTPAEALTALHMARVEAKSIPAKLKAYSKAWLAERGYQKFDGGWVNGLPKPVVTAEAIGIAVKSNDPRVAQRIQTAMSDAVQNAIAKGITEPPMQREIMQKARMKERRKLALA